MPNKVENVTIELQERAVNITYFVFTIVGCASFVFATFRAFEFGFTIVYFAQSVVVFGLVTFTIFQKWLSLRTKIMGLFLVITIVLISGLFGYGFLASGKILITTVPIFTLFIHSYKRAMYSLVGFVLVYAVFGYFYISGILEYSFELTAYVSNAYVWVMEGGIVILASTSTLLVGYLFRNSLIENYIRIETQNNELADSEQKHRILFEGAQYAIVLLENNQLYDCNPKACELFKCEKEELLRKVNGDLSPEYQPDGRKSKEKIVELIQKAFKGEIPTVEWQFQRSNGELVDALATMSLVTLENRNYLQGTFLDITERKKNELELAKYRENLEKLVKERTNDLNKVNEKLVIKNEELYSKNRIIQEQNSELKIAMGHLKDTQTNLIQSEKMASLGVLTAGVAHEINNPLNFILGGYEGLEIHFKKEHTDNANIPILLNSIKTGVVRASDIVKGLHQFSRDNDDYHESCNIHTIINNCLVMIQYQFDGRIVVKRKFTKERVNVIGNVGKLHQVFVNLLINAKQSIEDKGEINIATLVEGSDLLIEVSDNGCGIKEENLKRVIDPFYTTKDPGKGTGLGLSIAYSIVEKHNGKLVFKSELGKGTTAEIILPLTMIE